MACCYPEDCGEYAVTPMLIAPCLPTKCCEEPPVCYPCLPRCPKGQVIYCCEKRPPPKQSHVCESDDCCDNRPSSPPPARQRCSRSPPAPRQSSCPVPPNCCPTCCRPMKTKYVIPCYRYEDGRIQNQPTLLMRRACEVAVGVRQRRKPFVLSTYRADPYNVEQRYHSEDERGNCCFHFERKKSEPPTCCALTPCLPCRSCEPCGPFERPPSKPCLPCVPCHSCRPCVSSPQCQYSDCVHARAVDPPKHCCYYC